MDYLSAHYNADLKHFIVFLITQPGGPSQATIFAACALITGRLLEQADYTYQQIDTSYNELAKELHNGRLFRLLTKLNMIVERPQPGTPAADSWSETGDRSSHQPHEFDPCDAALPGCRQCECNLLSALVVAPGVRVWLAETRLDQLRGLACVRAVLQVLAQALLGLRFSPNGRGRCVSSRASAFPSLLLHKISDQSRFYLEFGWSMVRSSQPASLLWSDAFMAGALEEGVSRRKRVLRIGQAAGRSADGWKSLWDHPIQHVELGLTRWRRRTTRGGLGLCRAVFEQA